MCHSQGTHISQIIFDNVVHDCLEDVPDAAGVRGCGIVMVQRLCWGGEVLCEQASEETSSTADVTVCPCAEKQTGENQV